MKKNEPLYMEGVGYFIPATEGYAVGHDGFSKAIEDYAVRLLRSFES